MVRIYEKVQVDEDKLLRVTCDVCKQEQDLSLGRCYQTIRAEAGYASVLGDGNIYELDICDACFKEILGPYCSVNLQPWASAMLDYAGQPLESFSAHRVESINCPEEILKMAIKVFGSKSLAERWLSSPRKKFGGLSALELMKANEADQTLVSEALTQIDEGYFTWAPPTFLGSA